MTSEQTPPSGRLRTLIDSDVAAAWALIGALVLALVLANGPGHSGFDAFWTRVVWPGHLTGGAVKGLSGWSVRDWVNNGAMAIFFLVIGLEIAHERRHGELGNLSKAAVPVAGALGGMLGTALVYVLFTHGGPGAHGWGVPMATDVAFVLAALAVLGRRAPSGLRVFLLTLAVADDIGSVVVLAGWYSHIANMAALVGAIGLVIGLGVAVRWTSRPPGLVSAAGVILWVLFALAGVEPALAGVVVGLTLPAGIVTTTSSGRASEWSRVERWESVLVPVAAWLILPLFALANAGVTVQTALLHAPGASAVFWGVAAARVVGKMVGITAACWLIVRLGVGTLPTGIRWRDVLGGATVAGIGFTVPLLVASQAFAVTPLLQDAAEFGLLVGSAAAAAIGALILIGAGRSGPDRDRGDAT